MIGPKTQKTNHEFSCHASHTRLVLIKRERNQTVLLLVVLLRITWRECVNETCKGMKWTREVSKTHERNTKRTYL